MAYNWNYLTTLMEAYDTELKENSGSLNVGMISHTDNNDMGTGPCCSLQKLSLVTRIKLSCSTLGIKIEFTGKLLRL